jgi:Ca2+-transporting ATPase
MEQGMNSWYQQNVQDITAQLGTDLERGLENSEAEKRLQEAGLNELQEQGTRSAWRILWEQITATMVLILIVAAVLSTILGDYKDALAIGTIVILFAILGFLQDYRAERAIAALKRLAMPQVRVWRSGTLLETSAINLVPGDVIQLETGNVVPADIRIVESVNLRIQEAALTGESEPVEKDTRIFGEIELPLGDRRNMGYMGTTVTFGRGKGLVVDTGMNTELGQIASMLQVVGTEQTPLQRRLDQLGKLLALVGLAVAGLIFILGILRGEPVNDMLLTSVSIAVAVVPEGLPAVVTITLALGAQRMLKRQALIRRLPAVETLGSVTVICSDKTGTLTENRMTVVVLDVAGQRVDLSEPMRRRMPVFEQIQRPYPHGNPKSLAEPYSGSILFLLLGGALDNDAVLVQNLENDRFQTIGDPTEGALLIAAARQGLIKNELDSLFPRIAEVPFDSDRKRMSTVHTFKLEELTNSKVFDILPWTDLSQAGQPKFLMFTKGAVDGLLDISNHVLVNDRFEPMNDRWRNRILNANEELAQQGMRVLGVAVRRLTDLPDGDLTNQIENDLGIIGLFGMIDPPRPDVKEAVASSKLAGIQPVMITGDHPLTAREIARQLGIINQDIESNKVMTGQELTEMNDVQLAERVENISVFARVSPEHKLRIVQAFQSRGHIVAMTGDGVNDAPALKRADIGVAMGITGTDVSKEAAEIILQDDNFATIIAAVEEGRTIYDNLRKFIAFSVAGNIGKVLVMLLAPFLGKPLPLQPLQLLWLNLLTDGLLGLGLGLEPPEEDTMRRPPYSPKAGVFSGGLIYRVLWVGLLIGAIGLGVGYFYWLQDPTGNWQTITFTTLAFAQVFQAMASRSARQSFFSKGIFSNPVGSMLAIGVVLLKLMVFYVPFFQKLFNTQPLTIQQLTVSFLCGSVVFIAIEIEKWLGRLKERNRRILGYSKQV